MSVVRYRYNAAQVLAEILRQELDESDDERNNSFSVDNDSSECEDVVEVYDDVPDELDEAGVDISCYDSDDTVDYDVAAATAAAAGGDVVNAAASVLATVIARRRSCAAHVACRCASSTARLST